MKRRTVLIAAVAAVLIAALWYVLSGHNSPAGQPPLTELEETTLPSLQQEFNQHADEVRVILLLSPT